MTSPQLLAAPCFKRDFDDEEKALPDRYPIYTVGFPDLYGIPLGKTDRLKLHPSVDDEEIYAVVSRIFKNI